MHHNCITNEKWVAAVAAQAQQFVIRLTISLANWVLKTQVPKTCHLPSTKKLCHFECYESLQAQLDGALRGGGAQVAGRGCKTVCKQAGRQ